MTLGQYKNTLTKNGLPIGVERQGQTMPLQFLYLNSPPVVAVNCDNRKAIGKEKWHKVNFEKSTKKNSIEFRKQTKKKQQTNKQTKKKTKWKSNFKSTNS